MENKRENAARLTLKSLAIVAAVFALIGSIGLLVLLPKLGNSALLYGMSDKQAETMVISLVRYYDFARVGALILFGFAIVLARLDNATGGAERGVSTLASVMTAFGFVAVFMTSISVTNAIQYAEAKNRISSWNSSSSSSSGKSIQVIFTIAMILIMLSALAMIISLIFSIYRVAAQNAAARRYAYQQQYPQQSYPQQQCLQQSCPQQQYPQGYTQQGQNNNNTGV